MKLPLWVIWVKVWPRKCLLPNCSKLQVWRKETMICTLCKDLSSSAGHAAEPSIMALYRLSIGWSTVTPSYNPTHPLLVYTLQTQISRIFYQKVMYIAITSTFKLAFDMCLAVLYCWIIQWCFLQCPHTVRKFNWWRYCLALCDQKLWTISHYLT